MFPLRIRLKKKSDGSAALSCARHDGSITWQRQEGAQGQFFPFHDLTHYAVETVLRHRHGFYGLVASGWNVTDFGAPWPRGPIPADMDPSEEIVGFLDAERASDSRWSAADLRERFERSGQPIPEVTEGLLEEIRLVRAALFARWRELEAGEALELDFNPEAPAA